MAPPLDMFPRDLAHARGGINAVNCDSSAVAQWERRVSETDLKAEDQLCSR